jgi:hypothetical protein
MKRLEIPQSEKDKGMIWVVYQVTNGDIFHVINEAELKIQQEKN